MKRLLLLGLFVVLMADGMFGWGLGVGPGLSIKNAALYLIVILLALGFAVTREKDIFELPAIHLMFGLLVAVGFFSWAASTFAGLYPDYRPLTGLMALKGRLIDYYLFFIVFFLGARSWKDVIWLQRGILAVIVIGGIITVLDAYNMPNMNIIDVRRDGRVLGPLGEANQYGIFVATFLPIIIAQAWESRGFERVFFLFGAVVTFWVLVLTVSRGAYISLFAGTMIATFYLRKHLNARYVRNAVVLSCIAIFIAVLFVGQQYMELIAGRTMEAAAHGDSYEVSSGRTWIWAAALGLMLSQPESMLIGYGWNTFRASVGIAPHNTYLHYFFELGIFGVALFVSLLAVLIGTAKKAIAGNKSESATLPGLIGFTIGYTILSIGIFFVDLTNAWYFIWAYTGIAMRLAMEAMKQPATLEPTTRPPQLSGERWGGAKPSAHTGFTRAQKEISNGGGLG